MNTVWKKCPSCEGEGILHIRVRDIESDEDRILSKGPDFVEKIIADTLIQRTCKECGGSGAVRCHP